MLLSLGVTGLCALAVFITTASVVILQRREAAETKAEFEEYKLSVEGKVADAKREGLEAGKIAGNAVIRVAESEKEAAAARLQTEQIKQVVAWRVVPPENTIKLREALRKTPGKINLRYTSGDPESLFLAIQISRIFADASWQVAPGSETTNSITFGINLPDPSSAEMTALRLAFSEAGIPFSTAPIPDTSSSVGFNVSIISGAPILVIGSRPPPVFK